MDELERTLKTSLEKQLDPVDKFPLHPVKMREARKRRRLIAVASVFASVALIGAAIVVVPDLVNGGSDPAITPSDQELPTTAIVRCTDEGTVVETPEVRAQSGGTRIQIEHDGDARFFQLRSTSSDENEGGTLEKDGVTEFPTSASPGEKTIGCFKNQDRLDDEAEPALARLTIVDPEGLWNPIELACGRDVVQTRVETDIDDETPSYVEVIREYVSGLQEDDVFERPGYPGGYPIFETRTVVRGGMRIARVSFGAVPNWELLVDACRDSGIEANRDRSESQVNEPGEGRWEVPDSYSYEVASTCGERDFFGHFRISVGDGEVIEVEGLDEFGRASVEYGAKIPTLEDLIEQAEGASDQGADLVEIEYDSRDGHPTRIEIDYFVNGVDDEACYEIKAYAES